MNLGPMKIWQKRTLIHKMVQKKNWSKFNLGQNIFYQGKYLLKKCFQEKSQTPLDHLIFVSMGACGCVPNFSLLFYVEDLVKNLFTRMNVSWTNVVWLNVAKPLDHLSFVGIGYMTNFCLLGYADEFLKR